MLVYATGMTTRTATSRTLKKFLSLLEKDSPLEKEVLDLIHENGFDPKKITVNDIRSMVAAYARKVFSNFAGEQSTGS